MVIHIQTPCRLHFGMFSFGHPDEPQFGGVGMMVEPPAVDVTIRPAPTFTTTGAMVDRVERFIRTAVRYWRLESRPPCEIEVTSPPDHVGLGVGTQLGLAVSTGLRRFLKLPDVSLEELAASVGRGLRSSVGTHGFAHGGLIVDAGKTANELLSKLASRAAVPEEWRIVLVRASKNRGLAGESEVTAFEKLPPFPRTVTQELWRLAETEMLPALERVDCAEFGEAVYRFGRLAGECFSSVQGGPFASPEIERLIDEIRDWGAPGAGQSSWGPMVFGLVENENYAQDLSRRLQCSAGVMANSIAIARPNNRGVQISALW